jgi:hypothetical protein
MPAYNPAPRPPPIAIRSPNPNDDPRGGFGSGVTSPVAAGGVREGVQMANHIPPHRKRTVNKADISEPTFISCTSNIVTTNLPPGASLANGATEIGGSAPPLPPINPRRRMMVNHLLGRGNKQDPAQSAQPATAVRSMSEEHSSLSFSDDGENRPKWKGHRLKKSLSDGGNLMTRARQPQSQPPPAFASTPSTTVPMPARGDPPGGAMF